MPVHIRIICHNPPPTNDSLHFGLQDKTPALKSGTPGADGTLIFECDAEVKPGKTANTPNFTGSYTHGTPDARFLYLSYGTQIGGVWTWQKRIKITLAGITSEQIEAANKPGHVLEAEIDGRGAASVRLMGAGWTVRDAS